MVRSEYVENDTRIRHYSDTGHRLVQVETEIVYDEAIDVLPCRYTYVESDEFIPPEDITIEDKAEAYDILMGVNE